MDRELLMVLRLQAWEKAKGDLKGFLHTFFNEVDEGRVVFEKVYSVVRDFEREIDDLIY